MNAARLTIPFLAIVVLVCPPGAAQAEEDTVESLKASAQSSYDAGDKLFSALADDPGGDEQAREQRQQTRVHVDEAIRCLNILLDEYPKEEKWAEGLLEKVFALSFWLDRFTTIDDFDYESQSASVKSEGKRTESAKVALEAAGKSEAVGDTAAAFYEYLEVVQHHSGESKEDTQVAREKLRGLRAGLTTSAVMAYLKKEFKSDVPGRRIFAAQEMASLRSSEAAAPAREGSGRA